MSLTKLGLGLRQLRFQNSSVHPGYHLTRRDKIAFVDQDFRYAAGELRRYSHFCSLNAAIAAGETLRKTLGLKVPPDQPPADTNRYHQQGDSHPVFAFRHQDGAEFMQLLPLVLCSFHSQTRRKAGLVQAKGRAAVAQCHHSLAGMRTLWIR